MDFICDIDGTISDSSTRQHWLEGRPKNWKAFYAAQGNDPPIEPMVEVIDSLLDSGNRVVFCTGRGEEYREATTEWINRHFGFSSLERTALYMRPKSDHRHDDVVKRELLDRIRADGFNPLMAFEDRQRVVDMWREAGLICAQVAKGDF